MRQELMMFHGVLRLIGRGGQPGLATPVKLMRPCFFMNGLSMYNDGCYLTKNPEWHETDATWKAKQVLSLLGDRNFQPESIVDIGCGTGGVLEGISSAL